MLCCALIADVTATSRVEQVPGQQQGQGPGLMESTEGRVEKVTDQLHRTSSARLT